LIRTSRARDKIGEAIEATLKAARLATAAGLQSTLNLHNLPPDVVAREAVHRALYREQSEEGWYLVGRLGDGLVTIFSSTIERDCDFAHIPTAEEHTSALAARLHGEVEK